jgi:hypothetical protein
MPLRILQGESRYRFLVAALLLELLIYPYLDDMPGQLALLALLNSFILFAAIFAISQSHRQLWIGIGLAAPALVRSWTALFLDTVPPLDWVGLVFAMAFYFFATTIVLRDVLRTRKITTDTVFGAICAYALMGYAWAMAHGLAWYANPLAYNGIDAGGDLPIMRLIYFSFVTMTTLGYGDITPAIPESESLAILEAITGVMYMATLVARLVGEIRH